MKTKITCMYMVALLYSVTTWSQTPINVSLPKITPVSPEAAAVIRYVDYPVDYAYGLVPVEIPLFEIKDGDIVLPITLSYHSSGLKVKENSSWVGKGWTLNAEPSITRTVNGIKDEAYDGFAPKIGFLMHTMPLNTLENKIKAAKGELDIESDAYYFKLAEKSGKFYFIKKANGVEVVNFPSGKEKIIFSPYLSNFIIQDEDGIAYEFGFNNIKETNGHPSTGTVTRWLGDRISSAFTGAEVMFFYQEKPLRTLSWDMTDKVTVTTSLQGGSPEHTLREYVNGFCEVYNINQDGSRTWVSSGPWNVESGFTDNTNYEYNLERIEFAQGKILFTTDAIYNLHTMEIFDKNGGLFKKIQFYITKFNSITEHTKLDSLHIFDSGNNLVERYRFQYKNANQVPAMSSRSIDHWGYYNGAYNNNIVLVPPGTDAGYWGGTGITHISYDIGGANRASSSAAQAGMLEYIYWPGGRSTQFEYEMNEYWYHSGDIGPLPIYVGGLRIKRIVEKDLINSLTNYREFDYGDYGIIKMKPELSTYRFCNEYWYKNLSNNSVTKKMVKTWNSMSLANLVYANGAPVRYLQVDEFRYGQNPSEGKLKTIRKFRFSSSTTTKDNCNPFIIDDENNWEFGQLEDEKKYFVDEYNSSKLLSTKVTDFVHSEWHTYVSKRKLYFKNILSPFDDFSDIDKSNAIVEVFTEISGGKMLPTHETFKDYFPDGNFVQTEKTYQYNHFPTVNHHSNPVKITTTSTTGTITEDFYYPEDLQLPNSPINEDLGQSELILSNAFHKLLAYHRTENGVTQKTHCAYLGGHPLLVETNTEYQGRFENRLRYHRYNRYGNPACVSYENGPHIVYIWGYNNQFLLASIENTTYDVVEQLMGGSVVINAIADRITPLPGDFILLNNLRNLLPDAMVTTYTHKYLVGMTSETDPSGHTVFYEYDAFGRLKCVKDEVGNIIKEHRYNYAQ